MTTFARELHLLANEIADAERELQELSQAVFTLKNENDRLHKLAGSFENLPATGRRAESPLAASAPASSPHSSGSASLGTPFGVRLLSKEKDQ